MAPGAGRARGASLAAAAAVLGWAALRLPVLWKPVLSTVLPAGLDRAGTAVAGGLAVAPRPQSCSPRAWVAAAPVRPEGDEDEGRSGPPAADAGAGGLTEAPPPPWGRRR